MTDEEISKEALKFAKQNKKRIAKELTNPAVYLPDEMPISVFMAGSPGAGKTEYSKLLIQTFEKDVSHPVARIDADEISLKVSDTGYFVYCTGKIDRKAFDKRIEFDVNLIEHQGDDSWVEKTLFEIKKCLDSSVIPQSGEHCDWCAYWYSRQQFEK